MALKLETKKKLLWGLSVIFLILPILPVFWGISSQFSSDETKLICKSNLVCLNDAFWTAVWISGLLLIPYIIQLLTGVYGYVKMKDGKEESFMFSFCLLTSFSVITYSAGWFLYNSDVNNEYLSYICLTIIFILVTKLLIITFLFLHPESSVLKNYRNGLKQLHFIAIMHFFAIFLSIAFIAGFALAFHNRAKNYMALHMENFEEDINENNTLCKIPYPQPKKDGDGVIKNRFETCFYFDSERVNLEILNDKEFDEQIKKAVGDAEKTKELTLKRSNNREFENVSECIINIEKKRVPLVYILGKTDPQSPKGITFSDNYQLSSVRASNLYLNLTKRFSEKQYSLIRDIEWRIFPVSSDTNSTLLNSQCEQIGKDGLSNKRVVEVVIESFTDSTSKDKAKPKTRKLNVMDYMYFSLYTITTTGYGDIKPVTSYAKLICSVENIIEVFFLVIFVNILISFKEFRTIDKLEEIEAEIDKLTIPDSKKET